MTRLLKKSFPFSLGLLCCLTLLLAPIPIRAAELQLIEVQSGTNESTVFLHLDEPCRYKVHYLPAIHATDKRCYVDLYSTEPSATLPLRRQVDDGNIRRIRSGDHGTMLRVVLDLQADASCSLVPFTPTTLCFKVNGPLAPAPEVTVTTAAAAQPSAEPAVPENPAPKALAAPKPANDDNLLIFDSPATSATTTDPENDATRPTNGRRGLSWWGHLQAWSALDLDDKGAEDEHLTDLQARLGIGWDSSTFADLDLESRLSVNVERLIYDNDQADEETEVDLRLAYAQLKGPQWDASFGKQRVRWGKSDQLSPLDSINPMDMRRFMLPDLEDRAMTSWLGRLRLQNERFGLEAIVSPWFEESEIDYLDSDWALYRNLRQSILEHPTLPPQIKQYADNLRVHEDQPSDSLDNMSGALRLSWRADHSDFALSYRYGWETLPTITSFPVKNIDYNGDPQSDPATLLASAILTDEAIEATYKRQQIVGFEWEAVIDPVGFRGELAYLDDVAFLSSNLTSIRREALHLVTGIDYTSVTEWYFNLQASWYRIFDFDDRILYFEEDNLALLGEISKPVWRGNLDLLTRFNYNLTDGSSYVQPALNLKYFPNTECEVGVNIFSGDGDTLLGSHDQADQVYAQIKISF